MIMIMNFEINKNYRQQIVYYIIIFLINYVTAKQAKLHDETVS